MTVCLQLDVGNSSAKWRLLQDEAVVSRGRYVRGDAPSLDAMLQCSPAVDEIWVSSVAEATVEAELTGYLQARWGLTPWYARTPGSFGGLRNSYAEPGRMGVDRWCAMLGARQYRQDRLCVVDAGSALTIDLVAADGRHEGGYIIPGPALMERALLLDTDRVRFDEEVGYDLSPGQSTAEAVRHGIALAQVGAVAAVLAARSGDPPQLFFCGGAGERLMTLLDRGGRWAPDLVFEGLAVMARGRTT